MLDETRYPWAKYMSAGDVIGKDHTYDSNAQLDKFEEKLFPAVSERAGDIRYYVYDPTEHGFPKAGKYPLLFALHGANGSFQGRVAIDWAAAAMYASPEYQEKLGGMYIVCPLANEKMTDDGMIDSWPTSDAEGDISIYTEEQLKKMRPFMENDKRHFVRFGTDSIYSSSLYALMHKVEEEYPLIDTEKVFLFGTSAGGYMAWRLVINHPEDFALAVVMAGAYLPAEQELRKIEAAGTDVMVCHGCFDELVNWDLFIEPNEKLYYTMPNMMTFFPGFVRDGAHGIIDVCNTPGRQQGQHCVNNCIQANLIYDDGTLYDAQYPEGMIGVMKKYL